ncbi:MAG: thioredoxin domain-containing protein [Patescibacteria group bacterium]|jgi:protein-disulfide isomerase
MLKRIIPYILLILAGIILCTFFVIIIMLPAIKNRDFLLLGNKINSTNTITNKNKVILPDPLITTVPTNQQQINRKTKVFVSDLDPKLGNVQAEVFLIIYGDINDATTQQYLTWANDLIKQYSQLMLVWKDYTDTATNLTQAIHCLDEQDKFWNSTQNIITVAKANTALDYTKLSSAGASSVDLETCVNEKRYQAMINYAYYNGQALGVTNRHTLFVNDAMYSEPLTLEQLTKTIDAVISK